MSGSGKSTVLGELRRRRHRVVDTDDPGGTVATHTADGPEPVWDLDQIEALIDGDHTVAHRVAGQHARLMKNRYAKRGITAVVLALCVLVLALVMFGLSWAMVGVEAIVIAALVVIDRFMVPIVDRWRSGARGEEHVGEVIDGLRSLGWLALHDVSTGRGDIDHVIIGPGGVFTIETKGHRGKINTVNIETWMLKQAYAEAKFVERTIGDKVQPLLVFSRPYPMPAVSSRNGVTIVPARMLRGHLARRDNRLSAEQVITLHDDQGWIMVGIDHDTDQVAVNSIGAWWEHLEQQRYVSCLQITVDCGGSNSNRTRLWKGRAAEARG